MDWAREVADAVVEEGKEGEPEEEEEEEEEAEEEEEEEVVGGARVSHM